MIYITQGRFSAAAMQGMLAKPEDRQEQVKALVEGVGGRFLAYYVTLGEYDFLLITEGDLPLSDYVAALAVAGAGGGVSDMKSTVAMTTADLKRSFEKARSLAGSFRSAGQG